MPTGIESFSNPGDIGPIYPFVGTEVILAIVGVVLWIAFHVVATRNENEEFDHAEAMFDAIGADRVLYHGGAGRIASQTEVVLPKPPRPIVAPPGADELVPAEPVAVPAEG